ncbi:mitochondrial import inner membrane translocase subunit TIM50 [Elysia marginata]|uniref:Mitochondrial import inner membrane translocase subunit TIM50 n=1 Tax=Elysia marginata TaxID=1093978 RepID=A0AAV4EJ67_9GAST|nr:mitochondrial import inner membrane translocase subunit TIM50 [Elysia marginata]
MATFTVVMRSLTKGQATNLQRCLQHSQLDPRNTTEFLCSGIGSQLLLRSGQFSTTKSCFSKSLKPVSCRSRSVPWLSSVFILWRDKSHLDLPLLRKLPCIYSSKSSSLLGRKYSTSPSEHTASTQTPSDSLSGSGTSGSGKKEDQKESDGKSDKEPKKESWWRGKNSWRLGLIFLGGTFITWGIGLVNIWGAPQLDPDGNEIKDEFTEMPAALGYIRRTWKQMNIFKKKIQDPSREQLLPDPLKYPYIQPPYTLVIELTGVLIHPDWTYNTGWRFKKRPGIDYFLQQVGPPLFEVVIYSQEAGMTADPLVNHLDPQGYIMYRLYRDATRYMEGKHVKDLSCLNREMSRIIMLDCSKDATSLQPRNSLVLNKWLGEDEDRTLIDLAHFLKTIAASGVEDIRPVLDYYNQFDDPLNAFKDNQRKLQEEEEARKQRGKEESVQKKGWLSGFGVKR